jgi:hypothetical protein
MTDLCFKCGGSSGSVFIKSTLRVANTNSTAMKSDMKLGCLVVALYLNLGYLVAYLFFWFERARPSAASFTLIAANARKDVPIAPMRPAMWLMVKYIMTLFNHMNTAAIASPMTIPIERS